MLLPGPYAIQTAVQVVAILGACVLLVWVMTRGTVTRAAMQRVLDHPGLLVPAAMTTAALALTFYLEGRVVQENPLAPSGWWRNRGSNPNGSWLALGIVAAGLAGQIGLLEAVSHGARPNARALLHGIRRHFLTFALAKLAVAGGAVVVASFMSPVEASLIVFLVPSLLVAPIAGMASRHPNRPARALIESVRLSSGHVFLVGWPVSCHAAVVMGLIALAHSVRGVDPSMELLAFSASTVSFNHFPLAALVPQHWIALVTMAAGVFASAVFVTAHWLGVQHGYHAVRPEPRGESA